MEDYFQFKWGKKGRVVKKEGVQFQLYESFTLNGVEYSLYDCVYLYGNGCSETDIGKLVEIYDTEAHEKQIRVVWFFRPAEIRDFLGDYEPRWNEIFLASGNGVGLSNINPLEAIVAKCNVVCTSLDRRNPQPSEEKLKKARYIFCCTFDVGKREILKNFPDEIDGIKVGYFFNKRNNSSLRITVKIPKVQTNLRDPTTAQSNVSSNSKLGFDKLIASPVKNDKSSSRISPAAKESKKPMVRISEQRRASNETLRLVPVHEETVTQSAGISHGQGKEKRKVIFIDQPPTEASESEKKMIRMGEQGCASNKTLRHKPVDGSVTQSARMSHGQEKKNSKVIFTDQPTSGASESEKSMVRIGERGFASNETLRHKHVLEGTVTHSARISHSQDKEKRKVTLIDQQRMGASDTCPYKKTRVADGGPSTKGETSVKTPYVDKTNWFKKPQTWYQKLQKAQDAGQLVLLDNLDPSYTSSEIEGLIFQALGENVEAKMIQTSTVSTPLYGKAFVIFKSKSSAELAISQLKRKCLVLENGRPVIGKRQILKGPDKAARFIGHLSIDKVRLQKQREDMRKAVSTSHCAQPNTIAYDMAMEWCLLQERSDKWWDALREEQCRDIRSVRSRKSEQ